MASTTERPAEWAARLAHEHLEGLGQRWCHTLGVVKQARALAPILTESELEVLVLAAYLHDIGYSPPLAATPFHPLDGARYLRALGDERLASLVAFHSGARAEAEERMLAEELAEFRQEDSLVARALTYCDLVTGPDGTRVQLSERLGELLKRYGPDTPVARAARRSAAEFCAIVEDFEKDPCAGMHGDRLLRGSARPPACQVDHSREEGSPGCRAAWRPQR